MYAKLRQIGCNIEFLDIGGGLGVDYDGSKTRYDRASIIRCKSLPMTLSMSCKPSAMKRTCRHPNLVTESGRFMSAFHSVFITSIRDEIEPSPMINRK